MTSKKEHYKALNDARRVRSSTIKLLELGKYGEPADGVGIGESSPDGPFDGARSLLGVTSGAGGAGGVAIGGLTATKFGFSLIHNKNTHF